MHAASRSPQSWSKPLRSSRTLPRTRWSPTPCGAPSASSMDSAKPSRHATYGSATLIRDWLEQRLATETTSENRVVAVEGILALVAERGRSLRRAGRSLSNSSADDTLARRHAGGCGQFGDCVFHCFHYRCGSWFAEVAAACQ